MLPAALAASSAGNAPRMTSLGASVTSKLFPMSAVEAKLPTTSIRMARHQRNQRLAYQRERLNDNRRYVLPHAHSSHSSWQPTYRQASVTKLSKVKFTHDLVNFFKLSVGLATGSNLGLFEGCNGILLFSTRGGNGRRPQKSRCAPANGLRSGHISGGRSHSDGVEVIEATFDDDGHLWSRGAVTVPASETADDPCGPSHGRQLERVLLFFWPGLVSDVDRGGASIWGRACRRRSWRRVRRRHSLPAGAGW